MRNRRIDKFHEPRDRAHHVIKHAQVVLLSPLEDVIDSDYFAQRQTECVVALFRKSVRLTRTFGSLCFLRGGKFPLSRGEEEVGLPSPITGILGLQLYEFSTPGLYVVHSRATKILVDSVQIQEVPYGQLMLFSQRKRPQHHTIMKDPPRVGYELMGS